MPNDISWTRQSSGTIRIDPSGPPGPVPASGPLPPVSDALPTDPPPFDLDGFFNEWSKDTAVEQVQQRKYDFSDTLSEFARPFMAQGYNSMAALNRGVAAFSVHMDSIANYLEAQGVGKSSSIFETAANQLEQNAEYWQRRVDEVGISFLDEVISEAIGEAIPGITTFALDVASGYTFPFMAAAGENPANPISAGLLAAAKTGTLHGVFKMINPLKQYLRAPVMGTIFGAEDAANAPEGEKVRPFAKGFLKGVGYSVTSPGGRLGLNEIAEGINSQLPVFMQNQQGAVTLPPGKGTPPVNTPATMPPMVNTPAGAPPPTPNTPATRQRKFIETVRESPEAAGPLAEKVAAVDPQKYTIKTNAETVAKVKDRIATDGLQSVVDFVKSDAKPSAEKGAAFVELMKEFNRRGDFDRAVEMTELYDAELRASGQFNQAASLWSKNTPQAFIKWGNKQLDAVRKRYSWLDTVVKLKPESFTLTKNEQKEIMDLHRRASQMPEGPDKVALNLQMIDVVARKVPLSVSERFDSFRYQNMLSSPRTQFRNIFENIGNAAVTRSADLAALASVDFIKASFTGKEREYYIRDVPMYLKAGLNSVPNAIEVFKQTWKMEDFSTMGKPDIGVEAKTSFEKARIGENKKYMPVSRFMEASDKFTTTMISTGEMARLADKNVTPEEAYQKAQEVAALYTYRNKLDPNDPNLSYPSKLLASMGKWMLDSRKYPFPLGTISKWYIPFVQTPVNKAIQMVERTPVVGFIRPPKGMLQTEFLARQLTGSIITGIGATMAMNGETTWTVPTDEDWKKWFFSTKRIPFSVKIGEVWVPFWYLGPFAMSFGVTAAIKHYMWERPESMVEGSAEKMFHLSEGLAQFTGSQSSTQNVSTLFSALNGDLDSDFYSQTAFTVQQVIPAGAAVRYVNTIIDPVIRHPKGFLEKIEANLPILSKELDARMTPYFKEAKRDPINYVLPYDIGRVDKKYDLQYGMKEFEFKQEFLNNKMNGVTKRLKAGEITFEESLKEQDKILKARMKLTPKVTK